MPGESSSHATSGARRLAAIMSADIEGYSRHMAADEEGTHARVSRYRREIVEPAVAEHSGRIVKHMGDGFLAIFDSPLEATRCAIVIQQNISARNMAVAKTSWMRYRIGINLGDVIEDSDDVFGDGVNIAARLQTAAEPGGVNISGGVYEQVKNKLVCGYQSLGDEKLKNITDPVRIYKVLPDPASLAKASRSRGMAWITACLLGTCGIAFLAGVHYAPRYGSSSPDALAQPQSAAAPGPVMAGPFSGPEPEPASTPTAPTQLAVAAPAAPAPTLPEISRREDSGGTFRDCARCPRMARLLGGNFAMGSNEDATEKPVHDVRVAAFSIGRYPVTLREWRGCFAAGACNTDPEGDEDVPVYNVSWDDARDFVAWLSQRTAKPYRLPSEAEWEYAARAGTTTAYWWGARFSPTSSNCRSCGSSRSPATPAKVGLFASNPFGLFDMGGTVQEWVADCWHSNYSGAPRNGAVWDAPGCRERTLRGGSWRSVPEDVRVSSRSYYDSGVRYLTHGFRVALSE
jgi:formylglycine-generating enzyme required for sulfatase activity/class 3 adenylate cyclase